MSGRDPAGSFWPDPIQVGLLQVALGPPGAAADRWRSLEPLALDQLPTGSFAVLPLLYERLAAVVPEDPQLSLLQGTYRSTWYRNQLLLDRLATLLSSLRSHRVDPLIIGGAAALRWYSTLGSRPVAPLELIVPPQALPAVRAAAAGEGWRPAGVWPSFVRFVAIGSIPLIVHAGAPESLAGPLGPAQGYETLRERAVELSALGGGPLALDPADQLLQLCAAGARTVLPRSFQLLIDAQRILSSDEPPPLDLMLTRAALFKLVEPLRATVLYLAETVGTAGLEGHRQPLTGSRGNRRERAAFRLAGMPAGRALGPAQLLAAHLHATADGPSSHAMTRFPHHLQQTWRTATPGEAMAVGLRKAVRLLRASS
jgi:hypothetical protein